MTRFFAPSDGGIIANTTRGGTQKKNERLDTAVTSPAEASGVSVAMPTVRNKDILVLVPKKARLMFSGREVVGEEHEVT